LLPVLLFFITCRLDIGRLSSVSLWAGFPLIITGTVAVAMLAAIPVGRSQRGAFVQGAFRTNLSYLGLPIAIMVLGEEVAGMAAVLVGVGAVVNTVFSVLVLKIFSQAGNQGSLGKQVRETAGNPLIIAIVLGFMLSGLGIRLPGPVVATISMLSKVCLPSILLVMGLTFSVTNIGKYLVLDVAAAGVKLAVMPLIGLVIMKWLGAAAGTYQTVVVFSAMPTAVVSHTFAKEFQADEMLASSIVNFTTLALVVVLPFVLMVVL
jgi:predicted permease